MVTENQPRAPHIPDTFDITSLSIIVSDGGLEDIRYEVSIQGHDSPCAHLLLDVQLLKEREGQQLLLDPMQAEAQCRLLDHSGLRISHISLLPHSHEGTHTDTDTGTASMEFPAETMAGLQHLGDCGPVSLLLQVEDQQASTGRLGSRQAVTENDEVPLAFEARGKCSWLKLPVPERRPSGVDQEHGSPSHWRSKIQSSRVHSNLSRTASSIACSDSEIDREHQKSKSCPWAAPARLVREGTAPSAAPQSSGLGLGSQSMPCHGRGCTGPQRCAHAQSLENIGMSELSATRMLGNECQNECRSNRQSGRRVDEVRSRRRPDNSSDRRMWCDLDLLFQGEANGSVSSLNAISCGPGSMP